MRAKYTHRTNFVYALCISPCRELYRQQADKFVSRCLCTYSQQSRRGPERRMLIGRHSFIRQNKLSDVAGRIDYISNPKRQEHLFVTYQTEGATPEFWKNLDRENQLDFKASELRGNVLKNGSLSLHFQNVLLSTRQMMW